MKYLNVLLLISCFLWIAGMGLSAQDPSGTRIRHSDIFMTQPGTGKLVKQYHVTGVAWGFLPQPLSERNMKQWRKNVERVQSAGLKFQARIEFDAKWENMIDYAPEGFMNSVMRTLDGDLIIAPWFAERKYGEHPAYWFCSNSPGFRKYLKHQAALVLSGNPDIVMLDAQTSTALPLRWYAGCFCDHCIQGFREYLVNIYYDNELERMGINNVEDFDYKAFLKDHGFNDELFRREQNNGLDRNIPLFNEYRSYHVRSVNELSRELSWYIDQKAGRHITLSTSSPPHQPYRNVIIHEISHFTLEMGQDASGLKVPYRTIFKYKMAEAVNKKVIVTALPKQDWKLILDEDRPGLVRTWIAQAYGYGANFIAPVSQWASGRDRYRGKPEDFVDLYDFIYENAGLLDGYEAVGPTGLLLTSSYLQGNEEAVNSYIKTLTSSNIPFKLILVPDNLWVYKTDHLSRFKQVLLPFSRDELGYKQLNFVDALGAEFIPLMEASDWEDKIEKLLKVLGTNGEVTVLPRKSRSRSDIPFVLHLLNRSYDPSADRVRTCTDFKILISKSLVGTEISRAVLNRPGKNPLNLELHPNTETFEVVVPELEEWGIIAFDI